MCLMHRVAQQHLEIPGSSRRSSEPSPVLGPLRNCPGLLDAVASSPKPFVPSLGISGARRGTLRSSRELPN
eukprot:4974756-Alexandrium_andersonii.AAC.1